MSASRLTHPKSQQVSFATNLLTMVALVIIASLQLFCDLPLALEKLLHAHHTSLALQSIFQVDLDRAQGIAHKHANLNI